MKLLTYHLIPAVPVFTSQVAPNLTVTTLYNGTTLTLVQCVGRGGSGLGLCVC